MADETNDEVLSLAARILASGDPLDNEQVTNALYASFHDRNDFVEGIRSVLAPYFDNMLTLAGRVMGDEAEEQRESSERARAAAETPAPAVTDTSADLERLTPPRAMISLLKHMHPNGVSWGHLALAAGVGGTDQRQARRELLERGLVVQRADLVHASVKAMQDTSIEAIAWPRKEKKA